MKGDEYHQERVHLPVCPECLRVMKGLPGNPERWKCCGFSYSSTHEALQAYGKKRDHPDVTPSDCDFLARLLTGDCKALYGKTKREWIRYALTWAEEHLTNGDEARAAQLVEHELERMAE